MRIMLKLIGPNRLNGTPKLLTSAKIGHLALYGYSNMMIYCCFFENYDSLLIVIVFVCFIFLFQTIYGHLFIIGILISGQKIWAIPDW